ncbi:MAG: hypothetical protein ACRD1K_16010 [Acidimicrobiales bacterium]
MTVRKGQPWGEAGPLPDNGVVVRSDAEAGAVLEDARRRRMPYPPLGLLAGDLCRTLGGVGDEARLRSSDAVRFPVDLGEAWVDGELRLFVAHLVAHSRTWRRSLVVMNAQWRGSWNLGPRAHPNDGLLDTYDARLGFRDLALVRPRLHHGAHLPHPAIVERRASTAQVDLGRRLAVELDGRPGGRGRVVSVRVEPDALVVVV